MSGLKAAVKNSRVSDAAKREAKAKLEKLQRQEITDAESDNPNAGEGDQQNTTDGSK
ncbi:hypothetical protein BDQ17DRAFT_1438237 [Cyathus striatus]|nr:hypothetical protein BDQ17DRAFT_1438237 [Cyathus striatus]